VLLLYDEIAPLSKYQALLVLVLVERQEISEKSFSNFVANSSNHVSPDVAVYIFPCPFFFGHCDA
jgi:hypothetical protein